MTKHALGRRTLLRGFAHGSAVALGLAPLEAMFNGSGTAHADGTPLPRRFGVWFFGNGIHPWRWTPPTTGANWQPSEQLMPLAAPEIKRYVSVATGLEMKTDRGPHKGGTAGILTGANQGTVAPLAPSIDWLVSEQIGGLTRFRSLELGTHVSNPGVSGIFANAISYSGPNRANYPELDPRKVFARLFGNSLDPRLGLRRSLLDAVVRDAASLRQTLGAGDRARLDQHLDSVRLIEKRLAALPVAGVCANPGALTSTIANEDVTSVLSHLTEVNQVMSQVLARVIACDMTRVFTYLFTNAAAHNPYPEIGLYGSFHERYCHDEPDPQPNTNRGIIYAMERLADTCKALAAIPEGAGTLLDNCGIMATSCVSYGKTHSVTEWPALIIGRAGGALKGGVHYRSTSNENAARVPLTVARAAGAKLATFGVGNGLVADGIAAVEA